MSDRRTDGTDHWSVSVARNGDNVVTIESNSMSGRDLIDGDAEFIRNCATNLLAFIGDAQRPCPGCAAHRATEYEDIQRRKAQIEEVVQARRERDEAKADCAALRARLLAITGLVNSYHNDMSWDAGVTLRFIADVMGPALVQSQPDGTPEGTP